MKRCAQISGQRHVVDNPLCRMKSEAASKSRGRPKAEGRVQICGLGWSAILQSGLCMTPSKRFEYVAFPLSEYITYRVGLRARAHLQQSR